MYNLIEDYLDRLCLPLIRRLPYHERQRIRQEMRDHLLERVNELKSQGVSDDEAVVVALKQFGSPEWVGTLILEKRTPLPRLNWWRAVVLLLAVALTSLSIVSLSPQRPNIDRRQQQVVDAMLWTAGPAVETLSDVRNLLFNMKYANISLLPPVPLVRTEPAPELREIAQLVQTHYPQWFKKIREKTYSPVGGAFYQPMGGPRLSGSPPQFRPELPITLCYEYSGCVEPLPFEPSLVSAGLVLPLLALATITGLMMRRLRWVVGASVAAALLSLLWCSSVALRATSRHPARSYYEIQLQQVVQRLDEEAESLTRTSLASGLRPLLSAQDLMLRLETERPQRIRQLAQLFRHYQRDYANAWQQWNTAGLPKQTWWVFRYQVLVSWWSVPAVLLVVLGGGWLGILLGVWSWRLRSYLVHRYA